MALESAKNRHCPLLAAPYSTFIPPHLAAGHGETLVHAEMAHDHGEVDRGGSYRAHATADQVRTDDEEFLSVDLC